MKNCHISHLNTKCPFPYVPAKIIDFTNKTKKLVVFCFIMKKEHSDLHVSTRVCATINLRPTSI